MKGFARAVGRVLLIALYGAFGAAGVFTATDFFFDRLYLFEWLRHLLGLEGANVAYAVLFSLPGCLTLAVPEGVRRRSLRAWLVIAGTCYLGAVAAGIIVVLGPSENPMTVIQAWVIGCAAGYGLGAGIARRAWIAMIVGLLVGQLGGLAGSQAGFYLWDPLPYGYRRGFGVALVGAATILLVVSVAMELVDLYLKRKDAEAPAPAPGSDVSERSDGPDSGGAAGAASGR